MYNSEGSHWSVFARQVNGSLQTHRTRAECFYVKLPTSLAPCRYLFAAGRPVSIPRHAFKLAASASNVFSTFAAYTHIYPFDNDMQYFSPFIYDQELVFRVFMLLSTGNRRASPGSLSSSPLIYGHCFTF